MSFKLSLAGCGWFSNHHHGPAIQELLSAQPTVEFSACCDIVADRASQFQKDFGAFSSHTDISALIDSVQPDAILLAVPPAITFSAAKIILQAKIPLLLEKPPGLTSEQLKELTALSALTNTPTQVGFNRRYMPALIHANGILAAEFPPPAITQIEYAMIRFNRLNEDFSATAIHALDTLLFLARSPLREARLSFGAAMAPQPYRITMDATTVSGIHVHLDILPGAGRTSERICVHAIGQSLEIGLTASTNGGPQGVVHHWRDGGMVDSYSDSKLPLSARSGVYPQLTAFHDAVAGRKQLPTPALADCYQQVVLMEAMRNRCTTPLTFVDGLNAT